MPETPMSYTDRIKLLQDLVKTLNQDHADLNTELKQLRKYSDIAELIGHPKNPSKGSYGEGIPIKEADTFNDFRNQFGKIQHQIVELIEHEKGVDIRENLRDVFSGFKNPDELFSTLDVKRKTFR